jgi:hypothetical protein
LTKQQPAYLIPDGWLFLEGVGFTHPSFFFLIKNKSRLQKQDFKNKISFKIKPDF